MPVLSSIEAHSRKIYRIIWIIIEGTAILKMLKWGHQFDPGGRCWYWCESYVRIICNIELSGTWYIHFLSSSSSSSYYLLMLPLLLLLIRISAKKGSRLWRLRIICMCKFHVSPAKNIFSHDSQILDILGALW